MGCASSRITRWFAVIAAAWCGVSGAAATRASGIYHYQDYTTARAAPIPRGAVPPGSIILLCGPDEWRKTLGDVPPPDWLVEPPHMALIVGALNHDFSCQNVELRDRSDNHSLTLRSPSAAASVAPGGCAIAVSQLQRGPITVVAGFRWDHQVARVETCGDRIVAPLTDDAEFLRIRLLARSAAGLERIVLSNAKVLVERPAACWQEAIAGRDGVAIFQGIPAATGYQFTVQPEGCGEFSFYNQVVPAGRDSILELDLGTLTSLTVRVKEVVGGVSVPLPEAHVTVVPSSGAARSLWGKTDRDGEVVISCIASTEVDVRVGGLSRFPEDTCDITVGPGGRASIDIAYKTKQDPRRRPIPPICAGSAP